MIVKKYYLIYKVLNSLFLGLSVGTIFAIYAPLKQYIYSAGGVALGIGLIVVALFYDKILNIKAYFIFALLVELIMLGTVISLLIFQFSYINALGIYVSYQIVFMFGSYLLRAETLIVQNSTFLSRIDIAKQIGYILGMVGSFGFYKIIEELYHINDNQTQVYFMHFILVFVQVFIIITLIKSFRNIKCKKMSKK